MSYIIYKTQSCFVQGHKNHKLSTPAPLLQALIPHSVTSHPLSEEENKKDFTFSSSFWFARPAQYTNPAIASPAALLSKGLCQEPHPYQRHADAGFLQQVTTWRWFHATTHPARHRLSLFLLASAAHLRKIPVLSMYFLVDNSTESSSILKRNFCTGSYWCCFHPLLPSTSCSSLWVLTGCTMNRTTEINVPSNHKNHVSVLNNAFI